MKKVYVLVLKTNNNIYDLNAYSSFKRAHNKMVDEYNIIADNRDCISDTELYDSGYYAIRTDGYRYDGDIYTREVK